MKNNNEIQKQRVEALNHLIQTCKAGEYGFREAADELLIKEYRTFAPPYSVQET